MHVYGQLPFVEIYVILHVEWLSINNVEVSVEEKVADMAVLHSWQEWSSGVLQHLQQECIKRWTVSKILHDNKPKT